jgi:hypothetical protein
MLTDDERKFLSAFIHEATTDPFKGPATEELHRRSIYYDDLSYLMGLYYREKIPGQQGFGGIFHAAAPPCPWPDRESAIHRNAEAKKEIAGNVQQTVSSS